MSRLTHALTAPLRVATRLRRARSDRWPRLPVASVSVGNLALGGRLKTPLVAALAQRAAENRLRPGILTRGYPVTRRTGSVQLLEAVGEGSVAPWLASLRWLGGAGPAHEAALSVGDEAPWLAAVARCPVAVHPNRALAADALLAAHPGIDLLLLDDARQSAVRADVDLVLVDPARDLGGLVALKEAPGGGGDAIQLSIGLDLTRRSGLVRDLHTGERLDSTPPLTLAAAVGDPASVLALAEAAGLAVSGQLRLRDHHGPSARTLARVQGPLLVTEKDAVGWAFRSGRRGAVLGLQLEGVEGVFERVLGGLEQRGRS